LSAGVDVARAVVVGDAQVQFLRGLVGGQAFEDQGGVGEGLAAGNGPGVIEVPGGEFGAQASFSCAQ
jgi:hypothetical protein